MKKIVAFILILAFFNPIILGGNAKINAFEVSNYSDEESICGAEWYKTLGGEKTDWAYHIEQTYDEGFIVTGISFSYGPGQGNVWLVKTDAQGNVEWDKSYHKSGLDYGMDVLQTDDDGDGINNDGYIVLGYARNNHTIWLFKVDAEGNMEWEHIYPGRRLSKGHDIEQTNDGGFIIAGYTSVSLFGSAFDVWLIKTDAEGYMEWNQSYDLPYWDEAYSVRQTPDGGYIVAGGKIFNLADSSSVYLLKINDTGVKEWSKFIQREDEDDWAYCIQLTSDGSYAIVGSALFKTDMEGNLLWSQPIDGMYLQQATDGGYIIVGEKDQFPLGEYGFRDLKLVKTDSEGNIEWTRYLGGVHTDGGRCIQSTKDGGYIIAGKTASFTAGELNDEFFLIKMGTDTNLKIENIKGGLGISAEVINLGEVALSDLNWKIYLRGKLFPFNTIFFGVEKSGVISSLAAGGSTKIRNLLVFGIGPSIFQINAGVIVVTVHCRIYGFFVRVLKNYENFPSEMTKPYVEEMPI